MRDCDVLVVGGGGAGMAAAIEAADAGASVVVLEAGPRPGGSTALSGGVFYAAGTSIQRAAGVEDDVERMYRYYMTINRWNLEPWLIRRFCEQSAPTLEWLIGLGVDIPVEGLYLSGVDDAPRGHHSHGSGIALFEHLLGAASSRGVAIHPNVRVEGLLVEDGRIAGIAAQGAEMRAGAVVLATGGYGANRAMLAELNPEIAAQDERWSFYFGSQTSRGDGIRMAREAGAAVVGKGRLLVNASPGFSRDVADFHPPWLVFVNRDGQRFMDETWPYCIAGHRIEEQPGRLCFAIFDEPTRAASPSRHPFADKLGVGDFAYSGDRLAEEAAKGRVLTADTLDELAAKAGIDPVGLAGSVAAYNADVRAGGDRQFFKAGALTTIETAPFYAAEVHAASFGATSAGVRIDPDARVLGPDAHPIAGLYAAGETAGGVLGERYVGGGNYISNALIFGRIAGQGAAAFAVQRI
ncbi:FAD-dependent oxidoreductase [Rhizorhabdus wittichii]|uniref:FAD-dependent oxidoreductase n=1 Tax=Rhizorhabdus wittichii TaxID=160791 RepID=UPI0002FBBD86|nr:FAD-dependent oxidoreductase [Rhizorhabdus wittichii]